MTSTDHVFRIVEEATEPVYIAPREGIVGVPHHFVAENGFDVIVPDAIIEQLCALGRAKQPNEWMGILVGRLGRDGRGDYAIVDGVLCDSRAIASPGRVQSTPTGEAILRRHAAECFPASIVLGWAHGHLHCGARFSGTDFANQATWTMPYALGIVCDPWSPERIAVYYGPKAELLPHTEHHPLARELRVQNEGDGGTSTMTRQRKTHAGGAAVVPVDRRSFRSRAPSAVLFTLGLGISLWLQTRALATVRRIEEHAVSRSTEFAVSPVSPAYERPWKQWNAPEHMCSAAPRP